MNTKPDVTTEVRPLTLDELNEVSGAGFWSELGSVLAESAVTLANPWVAGKIWD